MNWNAVFSDYRAILFEFTLELYVFYLIFLSGLKKRPKFILRFLAGFVVLQIFAFGAAMLYGRIGGTVWGRVLIYLCLFALSVLHAAFCVEESAYLVIFSSVGSYAAQNLAYKIFLIFWYLGESVGFFPKIFQVVHGGIYYYLFYYLFFAVEVGLIYLLFARRIRKCRQRYEPKHEILAVTFAILLITLVLCTIEDVHVFEQPMVLRQTSNVFSVLCCAFILILQSDILERRNLEGEVGVLQYAIRQQEEQFKLSKETIDLINVKCHDMRHRLNALREGRVLQPEEIRELEQNISVYSANIRTGNKVLDLILTEKSLTCEKQGIRLSCVADGERLSFMSEGELYCLFGNIIENAVEAVARLEEEDKRTISLVIKSREDLLLIQAENYYAGEIRFENRLPVTTKDDKRYHGFGMKSIELIVHKYGGELTCRAEGGIFRLSILMPLRGQKSAD